MPSSRCLTSVSPPRLSAPPAEAAVAVGSVCVRAAVDGRPGGREVLPPPLGDEDHDGDHHGRHQDEAGDGDADGKVPLGDAERVGVVLALEAQRGVRRLSNSIAEVGRSVNGKLMAI